MNALILGAGGAVGIGLTRCLRKDFRVFGKDDGTYGRFLMEADEQFAHEDAYDVVIPAAEGILRRVSGDNVLAPHYTVIAVADDKLRTANRLGDMAPKFAWERDYYECGGAQGSKLLQEYLPGDNYAVDLLLWDGERKAHFVKQRLSYSSMRDETDDITGSAVVARCVERFDLVALATTAMDRVFNGLPNGMFTVDFREDRFGEPKVTEINAGKFATSSFPFFYHGYNLPLMAVQLFLGLSNTTPLGEYPEGKATVRGFDREPYYGTI